MVDSIARSYCSDSVLFAEIELERRTFLIMMLLKQKQPSFPPSNQHRTNVCSFYFCSLTLFSDILSCIGHSCCYEL